MPTFSRTSGPPTSSNGASSFHARWAMPPVRLRAVSAVFEVTQPPADPSLYFWALQATFVDGSQPCGAGHLGLQHHPSYPGNGAINWGGYHATNVGGGELSGTGSSLSSTLGNPNTFDYPWRVGRRYRLQIAGAGEGNWRGSVTDQATDSTLIVRDLHVNADHLTQPIVWSEVFADCDASPVEVRWSDLAAATFDGDLVRPSALSLSYQREADGGCSNTSTIVRDGWLVQRTNGERIHPHGATLPW